MISVLHGGTFTTVQDRGRWGYRAFGMPVAGAMDRFAFTAANLLVGNDRNAAVLEAVFQGPRLSFNCDNLVSLCGATAAVTLDGKPMPCWSSFFVSSRSEVRIGRAQQGLRLYLALRGGLEVPVVMGSRSTYARGALGGHEGRALIPGDRLFLGSLVKGAAAPSVLLPDLVPPIPEVKTVRALAGPHEASFTDEALQTFFSEPYEVSSASDRMGYRLRGPRLAHKNGADIISEPSSIGSVQVPGDGMPIILMADCQTTGGYTKIATVIGADLRIIAQAAPGDTIRFLQCSEEEAVAALREEQEAYDEIEHLLSGGTPHGN
ncbi:MAG: biotin-dependent carboxyltransferase family protein [Candidatus Eremiobacteraeota bacterium]|nr:biotin-dependent carboxyltransferase family protein [Candidatus Eremiobacteraeota bacterium]